MPTLRHPRSFASEPLRLPPAIAHAVILSWVVAGWASIAANSAASEPAELPESLVKQLQAPLVSVIEGQPLRPALRQTADRAGLNLWIDRRLDPSAPVDPGRVGPTVHEALASVAAEADGVVFPVANVVLVGRESWVEETAGSLFRLEPPPSHAAVATIDLQWPELTTPEAALRLAAEASQLSSAELDLPHDLWPAVRWRAVDPRVAITLILAQFDLQPANLDATAGATLRTVPANRRGRFARLYPAVGSLEQLEAAVRRVDRRSRFERRGDRWLVDGTIAAQRAATAALLAAGAEQAVPDETARFTLRLKNRPAGEVLRQLAGAAGKRCVIDNEAAEPCRRLVTLEGENLTLKELARRVAEQAGVSVRWGDPVEVTAPSAQ